MDEIIDHGINGLIVPKNNPQALAEAINYLCVNPAECKKMGDSGYNKAKKLYSPENIKEIESVYSSLLNNKNS